MSHHQRHRGQHANDRKLFSASEQEVLNHAIDDLSWLYSKGYAERSSLKLVGDRYRLTVRQRKAILRASCSDEALAVRRKKELKVDDMPGRPVSIDGYNLLITIESALAGGIVFECRDGCIRDIASIHSTYRKVEETIPALQLIGRSILEIGISDIIWLLDAPVSNSGRLRQLMLDHADDAGFNWEIALVNNPDKKISEAAGRVAISSDSWVVDHSQYWFNLAGFIIQTHLPDRHILGLTGNQKC